MLTFAALAAAVLFLSYSNGANDIYKGVATLYGSGTASYDKALKYAAFMTFLGSVAAFFLAGELIKSFSGKGLVGPETVANPAFLFSVALGGAITVFLATKFGLPISTTHSLMGGLIGAGFMSVGMNIHFQVLLSKFVLPLLLSPFLAILGASLIYPVFSYLRKKNRVTSESCICVSMPGLAETAVMVDGSLGVIGRPMIELGDEHSCKPVYTGDVAGINAQTTLNFLHYLSAGAVSFARGLNDTPKILGLMAAATALHMKEAVLAVGIVMVLGGLLSAKKVAETMSCDITPMNSGQGFTANLVTSCVVIGASFMVMPVSTTHVSVGSLFGIGMVNKSCRWDTLAKIFLSWVGTLPAAIFFSALIFKLVS